MFKQESDDFPEEIQKYGCYLFCLLRMCEIVSKRDLTVAQAIDIYTYAKLTMFLGEDKIRRPILGAKCSVQSPDKLCTYALTLLGSANSISQVGMLSNGKELFWGWANKPPYNKPEFYALEYQTYGEIGHHYVLANRAKETIYDPSEHDYTMRPLLGGLLHKAT